MRPVIRPNAIDKFFLSIAPKYGANRIAAKGMMAGLQASGYLAPGGTNRAVKGWTIRSQSADSDFNGKAEKIRGGSRDLFMNTPVATAALRRARTNVVGSGLQFQSRIDAEFLGIDSDTARAWERNVEREFRLWASSKNCDSTRTQNFYELQALAILSALMDGDVFALLPQREISGWPYKTQIKLIEADLCSNPQDKADKPELSGGVEIEKETGAPIAYYFRKSHPGDTYLTSVENWQKILAHGEESQRLNVIHLFFRERVGQRRGVPFLAPVLAVLKQATRLSDAELMAATIASFLTVFVTNPDDTDPLDKSFVDDESVLNPNASNVDKLYEMGSGNILELSPGQKIEVASSNRPNANFEGFFFAMIKQVGAAIEIPFEQLMLHFDSSYTAARGAILEAFKFYRSRRQWIATNFCQPVFESWLTEAILLGRIDAPSFFDDEIIRSAWCAGVWIGPGQGQIDPLKETDSAIRRIEANLSTHEDEVAGISGNDFEGVAIRRSRENEMLKSLGLEPARSVATSNALQSQPQDNSSNSNSDNGGGQ